MEPLKHKSQDFLSIVFNIKKILFIFILFFSCTADRGEDLRSFLEKNDGTEWRLINEDLTVYIRLNNDLEHLIEEWSFEEILICYKYDPNIFSPGSFNIRENSLNQLIVEGDIVLSDFECMTFTRQNDMLTVDFLLCDWQEETVYFNKSEVGVDNLPTCN